MRGSTSLKNRQHAVTSAVEVALAAIRAVTLTAAMVAVRIKTRLARHGRFGVLVEPLAGATRSESQVVVHEVLPAVDRMRELILAGPRTGVLQLRSEEQTYVFFFQAEDGIRDLIVTGVQTCALPISSRRRHTRSDRDWSSDVCSSDLIGRAHV